MRLDYARWCPSDLSFRCAGWGAGPTAALLTTESLADVLRGQRRHRSIACIAAFNVGQVRGALPPGSPIEERGLIFCHQRVLDDNILSASSLDAKRKQYRFRALFEPPSVIERRQDEQRATKRQNAEQRADGA